jgi:uncharacterized protein Veg
VPKTSQNGGRKKCSAVEALQEVYGCIFFMWYLKAPFDWTKIIFLKKALYF